MWRVILLLPAAALRSFAAAPRPAPPAAACMNARTRMMLPAQPASGSSGRPL